MMSCSNDNSYFDTPVKEIRQGEEYKHTYSRRLDELRLGTFDRNYDFFVREGLGSVKELILASKYNFRPVSFMDIKEGEWEQYELATLDAIDHYFTSEYGDKFWVEIEKEAILLEEKYKVSYYKTLIPKIISVNYSRTMIDDSLEIGVLNKSALDSLPFYIIVDTISTYNNSEYYQLEYETNKIILKAVDKHFQDTTKYLLPTAYVYIFWDSTKIDFPYNKYPLTKVALRSKYEWRGSSKGLVNIDEE